MGRPKYKPSSVELLHAQAFVEAFVASRYRERLRMVLPDLYEAFCHELKDRWVDALALEIPTAFSHASDAIERICAFTPSPTGVYLGSWHGAEIGEHPVAEAIGMVERFSGSVASIEPGEFAYYAPEAGPRVGRYLLIRDDARRRSIAREMQRVTPTRKR